MSSARRLDARLETSASTRRHAASSRSRSSGSALRRRLVLGFGGGLLLVLVGACEAVPRHGEARSFEPALTPALVAPVLGGLQIGGSTLGEVRAAQPALELARDVRYGGSRALGWNGRSAIVATVPEAALPAGVSASRLVFASHGRPGDADDAVLVEATVVLDTTRGESSCTWLAQTMGALEAARDCEGVERVHEASAQRSVFCLGTADEALPVVASCEREAAGRERLRYALVPLR